MVDVIGPLRSVRIADRVSERKGDLSPIVAAWTVALIREC